MVLVASGRCVTVVLLVVELVEDGAILHTSRALTVCTRMLLLALDAAPLLTNGRF